MWYSAGREYCSAVPAARNIRRSPFNKPLRNILVRSYLCMLLMAPPAWANPQGAQVIHGQATLSRPDGQTLQVANSPGTIIHWQGFSIDRGDRILSMVSCVSSSGV